MGFEAFACSNTGSSILHYGVQRMRNKKLVMGNVKRWKQVLGGQPGLLCLEQRPGTTHEYRFKQV